MKLLAIAFGGAMGAMFRYGAGAMVHKIIPGPFPHGTMFVNLMGSFLIGLLFSMGENFSMPPHVRLFVFTGLLGAFTTFSTFSLESLHLLRDGQHMMFFLNIALSIILGLALVAAGYFGGRAVFQAT